MHPAWARKLRDQCALAGVPFHFKQHGEWLAYDDALKIDGANPEKVRTCGFGALDPHGNPQMARIGVALAGRLLDGKIHNGFPKELGKGKEEENNK